MEECYICLEEESETNPFLKKSICKCKTLRIHEKCFKNLENIYTCSICKESFENVYLNYDGDILNIKKGGFVEKYTLNKNNLKSGYYKCYYPNGDLYISCFFLNGLRYGPYKTYYPNFILKESCWYNFGDKEGLYLSYYPNGTIHQKINYLHNKIHGIYENFDSNGNCIIKANCCEGILHKKIKIYHKNHNQYLDATYKKGALHGRVQCWEEDGTLQFDAIYKNGEYVKDYIPKKSCFVRFYLKLCY
jgi:antitoxin component YwqK of YwqJK toxin-antitoxin module